MEKIKKLNLLILLCITMMSLHCIVIERYEFLKNYPSKNKEYLTLWAQSDLHLDSLHKNDFLKAINDVNKNINTIDIAVVAGDIIDYSNSSHLYTWYVKTKKNTSIKYWYEIAGNHDHYDIINYKNYIKKPLHYSVRVGNILILLLSDENIKDHTEISDKAFSWWKDMVKKNQNNIIITVTHGSVKESGLWDKTVPNIKDSKRFADILKQYKVDIWICGHTHMPHSYMSDRFQVVKELNNALFINVAAIVKDPYMDIESNIFIFKKDSDKVLIRSRNHDHEKYETGLDRFHTLNHIFMWNKK